MKDRRGRRGSGIRRGWSIRAVGVLVVLGLAGFAAAQAPGMSRSLAGAATSALATTTLPTPDPPPVTKPKPKPKVRSGRRAATPKPPPPPAPVPPPPPAPVQPTTTYLASPPLPPVHATVAPPPPKRRARHRAKHGFARIFHKPPRRKAPHKVKRPTGVVLAGRALAAGPKVATVVTTDTGGKGSSLSILLAFLALPVLLGLAATLPARRLPARMGAVFEQHRTDLAISGVVGFGVILIAWFVTFALGSGGP